MCLDSEASEEEYHKPLNVWQCHGEGGNQVTESVSHTLQAAVLNLFWGVWRDR